MLQVRAPGAGPHTTLLVTDIESCVQLWEVLPADIMDVVIQVHHQVLRSLLPQYKGYESCTEVGDERTCTHARTHTHTCTHTRA